tara:strand:+ start:256 stop:723 length:468 start_codon:yes stop_codon:yes gene_type:complete
MNVGLVVFDLDFTLWDAGGTWCDHLSPPFRISSKSVSDARGKIVNLYPDAMKIFQIIEDNNIPMAIASRTEEPEWARQLLNLLGIREKFKYEEIFPDSKVTHFNNLHEKSGIPFKEMIFFDDEPRNTIEVGYLGVHCSLIKSGINMIDFECLFYG